MPGCVDKCICQMPGIFPERMGWAPLEVTDTVSSLSSSPRAPHILFNLFVSVSPTRAFLMFCFFFCTLHTCLPLLFSARSARACISSLCVRVPCSCVQSYLSARCHLKSDHFVDNSRITSRVMLEEKTPLGECW